MFKRLQLDHLDGHKVLLAADRVTTPGQVVSIDGEGMPFLESPHRHGRLHVTYTIAFPPALSEKQKAAVRDIFRHTHDEL